MELNELIRPNILALKPYSCARDEFSGSGAVLLDANENPYPNACNRYPDPRQRDLRARIAAMLDILPQQIVLGNGSDELIDMLIRSTCRPGVDNIVVFSPGYAMYEVCAAVNDTQVRRIDLTADFQPDTAALASAADPNTKLVFICSPNNPTGTLVPHETVARICRGFGGLVVLDEAYIDFADYPSAVRLLAEHPNLFVLQTLSKSWGMAGLRIGIGIGNEDLIAILDKVKAPYNISGCSQQTALAILNDTDGFATRIAWIKSERRRLAAGVANSGIFSRIYPSEANFLLAATPVFKELYDFLAAHGVVVRLRDVPPLIPGCLRISVGTPAENDRLLELLTLWKTTRK